MERYEVKTVQKPLDITVEVPGSKSITNRALLMAAMAKGESVIKGVLFSDDSEHFLNALIELGFEVQVDRRKKEVKIKGTGGKIPKKNAKIFVGSAGTAARFLTAFLAMSDGTYEITSSEQMKKRPMKELLELLESLGAKITYMEENDTFPMKIEGLGNQIEKVGSSTVELNIDRSSQFLSAMLMVAPLRFEKLTICLTGERSARAYVEMTEQMMKQFGHPGVVKTDENCYRVEEAVYQGQQYQVEPDVSAACYFYAMAAVTGGKAVVAHVSKDSLQGDMCFLDVLERMGCTLNWGNKDGFVKEQLTVCGPKKGGLKGITQDFCNFSDQALTMAAIAPFANAPVTITGIGHIRGQESDRLQVICTELGKMGIQTKQDGDSVKIFPGSPKASQVETYDDHRVAMSFAIIGLRSAGVVIQNPLCCKKTFPEYFQIMENILQ